MAADALPARRRPPRGKRHWARHAVMLATSAVCACLAARRWGGSGSGSGEWPPPSLWVGATGTQKEAAQEGKAAASPGGGLAAAGSEDRRAGEARRRGGGAAATRLTTSLATSGDFLLPTAASRRAGATARHSASSAVREYAPDTTPDTVGSTSLPERAPLGVAGAAAVAAAAPVLEREDKNSSGGIVRRAPMEGFPKKGVADATAVTARGGGDWAGSSVSAASAAASAATAALRKGAAASLRASTGGHPTESDGEQVVDGGARRRLRWSRRLQNRGGSEPPAPGEQEGEEEEETAAYDQEEDGAEGAFGSVGLLAFLVCFGLLFCAMEVAKCYFLVECRRRQRWRRQRARGHTHEMPIASSRVVAPEVPVAGAKDGWVDVVVHKVSLSAEKHQDGDEKIPSAHGYAVAGASHALQEAIEHARRLSPGRGYRAVFASPARPEQQHRGRRQGEEQQQQAGVSLEMSSVSPSLDLSEVQPRPASPTTAIATVTAPGMAPIQPSLSRVDKEVEFARVPQLAGGGLGRISGAISGCGYLSSIMPSHKTFRTKVTLGKKMKQNRPIPHWIRLRTDNTIRYNAKRRHWRRTKLGL
eukprot:g8303.t1